MFYKKKKYKTPTLQINGSTIPNKNIIKILGIIFDKKLKWKTYIKYLKKRNINKIQRFKSFITHNMGFANTNTHSDI